MRLVPAAPNDRATGSELHVFSLLAQCNLGEFAFALSSLNLAEHDYKRWGEIDFLIAMPEGLIALEVKGGEVSCTNGIWRFEDRIGRRVEKREAPLAQAQAAYSSLIKSYLAPALGESLLRQVPSGFAVVFPFSARDRCLQLIGGPEMPAEIVGFAEDVASAKGLESFIRRTIGYWRQRMRHAYQPWKPEDVKRLVKSLRPSVDRVEPLSLSMARARLEMLSLTGEQYKILDYLETAPRVLCSGGAGTGKTLIAAECLRRERNAVLVTGTSTLAKHLRAENLQAPGRIFSFEEIVAMRGAHAGRFDVLIVDEGQQITNFAAFEVLESLLAKPLSDSRWRWFSDANRQLSSTSNFQPEAQSAIAGWASVRPSLSINCRNTPQIVHAVELITGGILGHTRAKGSGPIVQYASSDDAQGCLQEAAGAIRKWTQDGEVNPGQVICLSARPFAQSSIPEVALLAGLEAMAWQPGWESNRAFPKYLGAATIDAFRGLEAPFAVLCDLGEDSPDFMSNLYLAMTRANFGLFVGCRRQAREKLVLSRMGSPGSSGALGAEIAR